VNDDCLKLTIYGGERHRAGGAFAADALLDLYERHGVAASVLLRGAQGFGLKHHLRTDRLLTLSEDLPVVTVAVDARERIEALLPEAAALAEQGLVTLERARMLTGEVEPVTLPEAPHAATKLTVYVGRRERAGGAPAHAAICALLHRRGIAGATVLLGVDGTAHGERRRAAFFARNVDVPLMVVAVGAGRAMAGVLPELGALLRRPLITLERVEVCKRDGALLTRPRDVAGTDEHGLAIWQKLMVYGSEHAELVRRLRRAGATGATSLRGIWGFHGDHPPHGDRLLALRRRVPVVTVIVDTPARIADSFAVVDELTRSRGLVTSELVPALSARYAGGERGGLRLAFPR
jgi:PII-like signaling protein